MHINWSPGKMVVTFAEHERDSLVVGLNGDVYSAPPATLERERDEAVAERDTLQASLDALRVELDAMTKDRDRSHKACAAAARRTILHLADALGRVHQADGHNDHPADEVTLLERIDELLEAEKAWHEMLDEKAAPVSAALSDDDISRHYDSSVAGGEEDFHLWCELDSYVRTRRLNFARRIEAACRGAAVPAPEPDAAATSTDTTDELRAALTECECILAESHGTDDRGGGYARAFGYLRGSVEGCLKAERAPESPPLPELPDDSTPCLVPNAAMLGWWRKGIGVEGDDGARRAALANALDRIAALEDEARRAREGGRR